MKNVLLGLLSLTTLSVLTIPAIAGEAGEVTGDKVIIQDSQQYNYQEGSGNTSVQETMQTHRESNHKKPKKNSGSYGAVQTSVQEGAQFGERNNSRQTNIQRTETRNRRSRNDK